MLVDAALNTVTRNGLKKKKKKESPIAISLYFIKQQTNNRPRTLWQTVTAGSLGDDGS